MVNTKGVKWSITGMMFAHAYYMYSILFQDYGR